MEYVRCSGAFPGIVIAVSECSRSDLQKKQQFFRNGDFARVRRGDGGRGTVQIH